MSANKTSAPRWRAHVAVETNVYGVVITAVPGPTPHASMARIMPLVLLLTEKQTASRVSSPALMRASFTSEAVLLSFAAKSFSNRSAYFPVVSQPERSTSRTAFSSSGPMEGREKATFRESQSAISFPPLVSVYKNHAATESRRREDRQDSPGFCILKHLQECFLLRCIRGGAYQEAI